jgi:hypothetical protein
VQGQTWNANGTLQQLTIVDLFTTSNRETGANLYDDLSRLIRNKCSILGPRTTTFGLFGEVTSLTILAVFNAKVST